MRRGEALGLRWSDVNLDAATASVSQALVDLGHELRFVAPKTAKGRRQVALDIGREDLHRSADKLGPRHARPSPAHLRAGGLRRGDPAADEATRTPNLRILPAGVRDAGARPVRFVVA